MFKKRTSTMASQGQASNAPIGLKKFKKSQCTEIFNIEDDKLLVQSWLNVSRKGNSKQQRETFWKRVSDRFRNSTHNQNSLMNRWSTIEFSVNKFCGCFAQVNYFYQGRATGVTEHEKVQNAKLMYKEFHQQAFPFEHCWNIMKYEPKWRFVCDIRNERCRKVVSTPLTVKPVPTPSIVVSTPLTVKQVPTPSMAKSVISSVSRSSFVDLEKPLEKNAGIHGMNKRMAEESKSANPEVVLIDIQEDKGKMDTQNLEILEKSFDQKKKRTCFEEERPRLEQQIADERIMKMDTSGLNPMIAAYFQRRQKEILDRKNL